MENNQRDAFDSLLLDVAAEFEKASKRSGGADFKTILESGLHPSMNAAFDKVDEYVGANLGDLKAKAAARLG